MKLNTRLILFGVLVVLIATVSKILFAPRLAFSGFSPIIAIALFSGMIMKEKKLSFLFPLLVLLISDGLIQLFYQAGWFQFEGFYRFQWVNYSLLLLSTLIGWKLKGKNYGRIFAGSLIASTLFFLCSNFFVWTTNGGYQRPLTFDGLLLCLGDGLPFYKNELIATLLYLPILIVVYNFLLKKRYSLKLA
jgi:hypothetical protein